MIQQEEGNDDTTFRYGHNVDHVVTVTVTVTEALVLRPLLEDRGHITESIRILVPVRPVYRQNQTEMFSDHDETSPSFAAVSARSAACSMLAVNQQKKRCRRDCCYYCEFVTCRTGTDSNAANKHTNKLN